MAPIPELPNLTGLDYVKFFAAGAACCTLSHGGMVPIDVVKTRMQLEPQLKKLGMVGTTRHIVAEEGVRGLATGFGSTAVGYLLQGGAKFAGYEFWKKTLAEWSGSYEGAVKNRTAIYLGGAAIAEFFADVLLTPAEAVRIRLVSDRKYASNMVTGFQRMAAEGGLSELYAGFVPILAKQIPYAVGQFLVNELAHEAVFRQISPEKRANLTTSEHTAITLGCGITAGAAAAVLSQPADTLLSQINKGQGGKGSATTKLIRLAKEAGPLGLFAGLGPRIVMTAGLVSSQFYLYALIRDALGAGKGVEIHKD
ncbi:Mir1p [Rhodotorula paludigena]|uniref:Mir1p n=1 Tax=Rhodotorula paludigena TaxID=86838 RepID=UPI003181F50F